MMNNLILAFVCVSGIFIPAVEYGHLSKVPGNNRTDLVFFQLPSPVAVLSSRAVHPGFCPKSEDILQWEDYRVGDRDHGQPYEEIG